MSGPGVSGTLDRAALSPGSGNPNLPRKVAAVRTRPADWQPPVGTVADVSAWLLGPARDTEKAPEAFDEFCWRVLGAGLAIARATLHVGTLDPATP
jgi:hypothetical protein